MQNTFKILWGCIIAVILAACAAQDGGPNLYNGGLPKPGATATPAGGSTSTPTPTAVPALAVSPNPALVSIGTSQAFSAIVNGSGTAPSASWYVNGVLGGTSSTGIITASGNYTAPSAFPGAGNNSVIITALVSPNSATSNVTIVYPFDNARPQTPSTNSIKMGTSGGNATDVSGLFCCSGTLGALILRGGTQYILSNNHVLDKSDRGTPGQFIIQPGFVDTNCNLTSTTTVGTLTQAIAITPTDLSCPASSGCGSSCTTPCGVSPHNVDVAIAQVAANQVDPTGAILDLGTATTSTINALPPSATLATPAIGQGVAKSGRTTGLTCSSIISVNTGIQIGYDSSCGATSTAFIATYTNQVVVQGILPGGFDFSKGGDSGSLIVTSDTARPVALLYGGNSTTTVGNPIQDVITQLTSGGQIPTFVGGLDHPVSCVPTNINPLGTAGAQSATLSTQELRHLATVKAQYSAQLMAAHPEISSVDTGVSADDPRAGALLLNASGPLEHPVPNQIEGVRTRVMYSGPQTFQMRPEETANAIAVKEAHVASWLGKQGVFGFGVGQSLDDLKHPAVTLFVETDKAQALNLPAEIDGVRTRLMIGERFSASHWGHDAQPRTACSANKTSASKQK